MMFYDWKFAAGFAACIIWTVLVMGVIMGASAAYTAEDASEATVEIERAVEDVRDSEPKVDGPVAKEIEGTNLEKYDELLTRDPRVSDSLNKWVVVPAVYMAMVVADISASLFYDYLLWVPQSVVSSVLQVAGIAPMIGLMAFQLNRVFGVMGDLR